MYSGDDPMEVWRTGMVVVCPCQLIVMRVTSHLRTANNSSFIVMAITMGADKCNWGTVPMPNSVFIGFYVLMVIQCCQVHDKRDVVANLCGLGWANLFPWHRIGEQDSTQFFNREMLFRVSPLIHWKCWVFTIECFSAPTCKDRHRHMYNEVWSLVHPNTLQLALLDVISGHGSVHFHCGGHNFGIGEVACKLD